jgi:hypothetical protein
VQLTEKWAYLGARLDGGVDWQAEAIDSVADFGRQFWRKKQSSGFGGRRDETETSVFVLILLDCCGIGATLA